jgi:uncharacterized membrane protein (Fun14 family)
LLINVAQAMSIGGATGLCAGYTAKKVGQLAALTLGVGFVALQVLAYNGYVTVNWTGIQKKMVEKLDSNGDGKIDHHEAQALLQKVGLYLYECVYVCMCVPLSVWVWQTLHVMQHNLPQSSGFAVGFLLGVRYG